MPRLDTDHPAYMNSSQIFVDVIRLCNHMARIHTGVATIDVEVKPHPGDPNQYSFHEKLGDGFVQGSFHIQQMNNVKLKRGLRGDTLLEFSIGHKHDEYVLE